MWHPLLTFTNDPDAVTPPPVVVVVDQVTSAGIKRRPFRVRRADFSSQENYELALKAAIAGAGMVELPELVEAPVKKAKPKIVVKDTAIKVSAESLLALQAAAEMDEIELIKTFIRAIESEYE